VNPLLELKQLGQSVWLDNISRGLINSGELKRLVEQDGIWALTCARSVSNCLSRAWTNSSSRSTSCSASSPPSGINSKFPIAHDPFDQPSVIESQDDTQTRIPCPNF
jgi:hypothetical protein